MPANLAIDDKLIEEAQATNADFGVAWPIRV